MSAAEPYKLMVVDDSVIIRGIITRILEKDPLLKVVTSANNGKAAIHQLDTFKKNGNTIDVIILDIEMPEMDGITAIPHLLALDPSVKIIMASTLTLRNANISLKAMELGASDYIPKPSASYDIMTSSDFNTSLIEKVKTLGAVRRAKLGTPVTKSTSLLSPRKPITLRPQTISTPKALAIASSTGGPQALIKIFTELGTSLSAPIFITQHMPPTFTKLIADHLAQASGIKACEASEGMIVEDNHLYVAPGNYHMLIKKEGMKAVLSLTQTEPENYCRPSADPMLRSLADYYKQNLLTLVLTGMGQDGLEGSKIALQSGGTIWAQDEESSVVWGMPGAVATHGLCSRVLPLDQIATQLCKTFRVSMPLQKRDRTHE